LKLFVKFIFSKLAGQKLIVSEPSPFLRSDGASCADKRGVKDKLFKRHGRWLSESAKDGYVKDLLQERLSVSLTLGL